MGKIQKIGNLWHVLPAELQMPFNPWRIRWSRIEMSHPLVKGFLIGFAVAVLIAGGLAYLAYSTLEKHLSPEATQKVVEQQLKTLVGTPVAIGQAQVTLPNLLTLNRVRIDSGSQTVLSVEKIEAAAEGGLSGLQQGRFVEVVLTQPTLRLEKRNGEWNITDILKPVLTLSAEASPAQASPPASAGGASQAHLALRSVVLKDLHVSISEMDGTATNDLQMAELTLVRAKPEDPWSLHCKGSTLRLNPSPGERPLIDVLASIQEGLKGIQPSGASQTKSPSSPWLAGVELEETSIELSYPDQIWSIEGLSIQADQLFEMIRFQTGSLEKKNSLHTA